MKRFVIACFLVIVLVPLGLKAQAQLGVTPSSVQIGITISNTWVGNLQIENPTASQLGFSLLSLPPQLIEDQVAYHPFNDHLMDLFSHQAGSNVNTSFGTDRFDHYHGAASFNGTSSWVTWNYILENTFSISFWAKPDITGSLITEGYYNHALYTNYLLGPEWGGTGNRAGLGIALNNQGIMVIEHADVYMPCLLSYAADLSDWHHYTIVFQNHRPSLWIDGLWVRDGLQSQKQITYLSHGFGSHGYGSYWGLMDDLCVFDAALSSARISSLYQYTENSRYGFSPVFGNVGAGSSVNTSLSMQDSSLPEGTFNDVLTLCQAGSDPLFVQIPVSLSVSPFGPMAPSGLTITRLTDGDYRLEWDPVSQTTNGQIYTPMIYRIYSSSEPGPDWAYSPTGSSTQTFFVVDSEVLPAPSGRRFFYVKAE